MGAGPNNSQKIRSGGLEYSVLEGEDGKLRALPKQHAVQKSMVLLLGIEILQSCKSFKSIKVGMPKPTVPQDVQRKKSV
jgi:hypothetical protein